MAGDISRKADMYEPVPVLQNGHAANDDVPAEEVDGTVVHKKDVEASVKNESHDDGVDIMYGIEDTPPWYMCILLGTQVSSNYKVKPL